MRVLFAASEAVPFVKTGGLADVAGALPAALAALGHEVTLVLPLYSAMDRARWALTRERDVSVSMAGKRVEATLWRTRNAGVDTVFVDAPAYFARPSLYGEGGTDYLDNAERFAFFSRAVLELCPALGIVPDVIHVNDWQTALVAPYLKAGFPEYATLAGARVLVTVHNLAYQGVFAGDQFGLLGLPAAMGGIDGLEFYGGVNFLKGALVFADAISTVSRTYAREIQEPANGCGLDGVLRTRHAVLSGIVNGIDTTEWDPAGDTDLAERYTVNTLAKRARNRHELCRTLGIVEDDRPVYGMVSRLVEQKGLFLLLDVLEPIIAQGIHLAIVGDGDPAIMHRLRRAQEVHPGRIGLYLGYDNRMARRVYGGCDLFLMPSRFEPCGLSQLIAMRYGAPPVVHLVGGLADTVLPHGATPKATGFGFSGYSPGALLTAVEASARLFADRAAFTSLQKSAMKQDVSWQNSAAEYVALYKKLVARSAMQYSPA